MKLTRASLLVAFAGACTSGTAFAQVYPSSTVPVAIPDSPTATDTITVSGGPASITGLTVVFRADHTWNSDIDVLLVRGTSYVHLMSDIGGSGDGFANVRFDSAAAESITSVPSPTSAVFGTYRPEGGAIPTWAGTVSIAGLTPVADLTGFNGTDSNGDWQILIDDDAGGDTGTLNYWSLEFNGALDPTGPGAPPPPPPAFTGDFTATPNLLAADVPFTGTTVWDNLAPQPGLTDGAGESALGTSYAGNVFTYANNEVGFRIEHPGGLLKLDLTGFVGDHDLILIDGTGTPAGALQSGTFGGATPESITRDLAAGTYYAAVEPFGAAGSFTLTYSVIDEGPCTVTPWSGSFATTPNVLNPGDVINGTTICADPLPSGLTDGAGEIGTGTNYPNSLGDYLGNEVAYVVNHPGGNALFTLTGLSQDLDLLLIGAGGTPGDVIAGSLFIGLVDEEIEQLELAAGTYYIVVDTDATGLPGSTYTLSYTVTAPPPAGPPFSGSFCGTPNLLAVDTPTFGTTSFDPLSPQPGLTDGAGELDLGTAYTGIGFSYVGNETAYRIEHPGGSLRVTLTDLVNDLDLVLLDATCTPAGAIGDSTFLGLTNEVIEFASLPAGTYYAVADTFGVGSPGSSFTITYTQPVLAPVFPGTFAGTPNNLACGTPTTGTTVFDELAPQPGLTDGAGEAAAGTSYAGAFFSTTGNEVAYAINWPGGDLTVSVTGQSADNDLIVIGAGGTPADALGISDNGGTVDETVTLLGAAAGTYYAVVDGFTTGGTYTIEYACGVPTCPCPFDYNNSGSTIPDIDDLLAFFDDFNNGLEAADVNCTGAGSVPDIDDLLFFFDAFNGTGSCAP